MALKQTQKGTGADEAAPGASPDHAASSQAASTSQDRGVPATSEADAAADASQDRKGGRSTTRDAVVGGIFMAVVLVGFAVYVMASGQSQAFLRALSSVRLGWVVACGVAMVAYLGFGTLAFSFAAALDPRTPLGVRDLCAVEAAGSFFGNLTPMMMGSVPAQVWILVKEGEGAGEATALQLTRFLMYQVAEITLCGALLAASWGYFSHTYGAVIWVNLALFVVKLVQLVVTAVVCLFPGWVNRLGDRVLDWVARRGFKRLAPHVEPWRTALHAQVQQFSVAFRRVSKHVRAMAAMYLASALQLALLYGTPWFICRAFGLDTPFLMAITAGALMQFVSNSVPLPGGTGGIEAAFAVFFGPVFGASATAAYLVWRLVTFYGYTVLTGIATTLRNKKGQKTVHDRFGRLA